MPKKLKIEKIEGRSFGDFFAEKSLAMSKNIERGTLWSRPVLYVTRETFLVKFLGPTGAI